MAERGKEVPSQVVNVYRRLTLGQRILVGTVTAGVLVAVVMLVTLVNRPSYSTLFSNLNPDDASKIVEKLKEKGVAYALEDGGKSIQVPKPDVYELRLSLAGQGLPNSSVIGYEIFDRTNLGISDFVQKVNYRRALEGELARTILTLEEVEGARVHLVVPERALFKEDEKPSTASVVLKLKTGKPLKRETIQGITHLVASSIEGLESSNVTIVSAKGDLLSDQSKSNSIAAMTSTQYELQQQVEAYLAHKAQTLLESVVGVGNAVVQVSADLDFRQVDRTLEQYDPEKTAVRSEQISEEKSGGDSAATSARNSTVTNYEVNKTIEHIVEGMGGLKRLSVAALVNGMPQTVQRGDQTVTEIVPRSDQEMTSLTELVKKAVGFSVVRNDEVTVTNLSFRNPTADQEFLFKQSPSTSFDVTQHVDTIVLVVSMIAGLVILWSLLGRLRKRIEPPTVETTYPLPATAVPGRKGRPQIAMPDDEEMAPEVVLRGERRKRVSEYVRQKPDEGARLLKVWLTEE